MVATEAVLRRLTAVAAVAAAVRPSCQDQRNTDDACAAPAPAPAQACWELGDSAAAAASVQLTGQPAVRRETAVAAAE